MARPAVPTLIESLQSGDRDALGRLFDRHRAELRNFARALIDRRLSCRLDASDVVQQTYLEAESRLGHYVDESSTPFASWIRTILMQTMIDLHRHHLLVKKRSVSREVSPRRDDGSSTCEGLLPADQSTPSALCLRNERKERLHAALDRLGPTDREVLRLRHFEHLSNVEVAERLGLGVTAASNRYVRALQRLETVLRDESRA